MLRFFNTQQSRRSPIEKNRIVEIGSYTLFCVVNIVTVFTIESSFIMPILQLLMFIILSYNYRSTFIVKVKACLYTFIVSFVAEMIVLLMAGLDMNVTAEVSKDTLYLFLLTKIIAYVTITYLANIFNSSDWFLKRFSYLKIYIPLIAVVFLAFLNIIIQADELTYEKAIMGTLILLYILSSVIIMLVKDQRGKKYIDEEMDNLRYQQETSEAAFNTLAELKDSLSDHIAVLRELAGSNYAIIMGINNIEHRHLLEFASNNDKFLALLDRMAKEALPHCQEFVTGNKILDQILNEKIAVAEKKGIKVVHEIMLAHIDKFDGAIIYKVLTPLLDAAIEELEGAREKVLYFSMKSLKGPIMIWLLHANEVEGGRRTSTPFIYNDTQKMRAVKKIVTRYHGVLEIKVVGKNIEVHARFHMPELAKIATEPS
jgi:hypothetical protein